MERAGRLDPGFNGDIGNLSAADTGVDEFTGGCGRCLGAARGSESDFSLPMGALIDRWDRKRVMIHCDVWRAIAVELRAAIGSNAAEAVVSSRSMNWNYRPQAAGRCPRGIFR